MGGWGPDEVRELFDFLEFRTSGTGCSRPRRQLDLARRRAPPTGDVLEVEVRRVDHRRRRCAGRASCWPPVGPVAVEPAWEAAPGRRPSSGWRCRPARSRRRPAGDGVVAGAGSLLVPGEAWRARLRRLLGSAASRSTPIGPRS